MKTTPKTTLGREVLSILAVKRIQAIFRLKEEVLPRRCVRELKEKR